MIRKFLRNETGFTLVQGIVLAGVLAGSALVAVRLISDQKLAQKGAETRDNIEELHKLIYSALQNKDHCISTFGSLGNTFVSGNPGDQQTINLSAIRAGASSIVEIYDESSEANKIRTRYFNQSVIVTGIVARYPLMDPSYRAGYGRISISYRRLDQEERLKSGFGGKDLTKHINLRVQRNPQNTAQFTGCYAVSDASMGELGNNDLNSEFCRSLNSTGTPSNTSFFEWDEENSTCVPKDQVCNIPGFVNTGINSNGQVECQRLEDWIDFNRVLDQNGSACPAGTRNPRLQIISGRVRIVCDPP